MYHVDYDDHFHPSIVDKNKEYILSHGKGLPCVCSIKNNYFSLVWYNHIKFIKVNKYILYTNVNKIDTNSIFAATSSYFGPLADTKMRKYFEKISFVAFKVFQFIWRRDFSDFSISIPIHELNLQFSDGCLWDCYGLNSALLGLKQESLLHNAVIVIFTNDICANNEWWENGRKRNKLYPNSSLFQGNISDNLESSFSWDNIAYVNTYKNCKIHEKNPFYKWYDNGVLIDVILIGIKHPENISSIPIYEQDVTSYKTYETRINMYLPVIFSHLNIHDRVKGKTSTSVCISGGACKTALLGMIALKYIHDITQPKVVVGTSGGAWGVCMYYKYKSKSTSFYKILTDNCKVIRQYVDIVSAQAIRKIEDVGKFSVLTRVIPTLSQLNVSWETIVNVIINGDNRHKLNWTIFPSNLRVLIPISLLCNSYFGRR